MRWGFNSTLAGCGKTPSTIPLPPSWQEGGKNLYLRDTLRLPARGEAPLHSPFFSSLLFTPVATNYA